jgi:hypothetical protein
MQQDDSLRNGRKNREKRKPDVFFTSLQAGLPQKYTPPSGGVIFPNSACTVFGIPFRTHFVLQKRKTERFGREISLPKVASSSQKCRGNAERKRTKSFALMKLKGKWRDSF